MERRPIYNRTRMVCNAYIPLDYAYLKRINTGISMTFKFSLAHAHSARLHSIPPTFPKRLLVRHQPTTHFQTPGLAAPGSAIVFVSDGLCRARTHCCAQLRTRLASRL